MSQVTLTLTAAQAECIHKALCLLAEAEDAEAKRDPMIDAMFPEAAADRASIRSLAGSVYAAQVAAGVIKRQS